MVTQELLDQIKDCLVAGLPKEKIISDLSAGGWEMSSIQEAFDSLTPNIKPSDPTTATSNKYWTKYIPHLNKWAMVVSLTLFLGLDLIILIFTPVLFIFWAAMAVVMLIFWRLYLYENRILKKRFKSSKSKLDRWILVMVVIRNVVFILNVIPFIQLFGGAALIYGGIPYIIIYYLLLRARNKSVASVA